MMRHRWDISPKEAIGLQRALAPQVRVEPLAETIETVAGADCAFTDGGRRIIAAAVLCDADSMAILATEQVIQPLAGPTNQHNPVASDLPTTMG